MDGCVAHTSLVRYDAMNELSGQQSSTVALLDSRHTGIVISSILHRDQARFYVKRAARGQLRVRALAGGAGGGGGRARRARTRPLVVRVAYLGPAGTHSEEALRASAPEGAEQVPYPTIYDAVMAVQQRAADRAVVPIENALEGGVAVTLDTLVLEAVDVRIGAELVHPDPSLPDRGGAARPARAHARVVSHPQAIAQCARFLRERLPSAEHVSAPSTADAVASLRGAGRPDRGARVAARGRALRLRADRG